MRAEPQHIIYEMIQIYKQFMPGCSYIISLFCHQSGVAGMSNKKTTDTLQIAAFKHNLQTEERNLHITTMMETIRSNGSYQTWS